MVVLGLHVHHRSSVGTVAGYEAERVETLPQSTCRRGWWPGCWLSRGGRLSWFGAGPMGRRQGTGLCPINRHIPQRADAAASSPATSPPAARPAFGHRRRALTSLESSLWATPGRPCSAPSLATRPPAPAAPPPDAPTSVRSLGPAAIGSSERIGPAVMRNKIRALAG